MEETHQKVIQDLQRQHQREISKLMEERERLLAEETAATIAGKNKTNCITSNNRYTSNKTDGQLFNVWLVLNVAIEAMKNAHKEEMEKTHRSQLSGLNSDIDELRLQYEYVLFTQKLTFRSIFPVKKKKKKAYVQHTISFDLAKTCDM